jgi:cobalt-zinc-cadmium efflux system protein
VKRHDHRPGDSERHEHERHHGHEHSHGYKHVEKKRLILAMSITGVVMVLELVGGYLTNSLALMSDGGHMFTHLFALAISYVAIVIASKDPCHHRTYGFYRMEVLAALFNSLFLFGVTAMILYEAVHLFMAPEEVKGLEMLLIAVIGLAVNIASIFILRGSARDDMNIKAAFFHVMADAVSSVVVVAAAIVIHFTSWTLIDPIMAAGISLLILVWAIGLFKDSVNVLLETAPKGMDTEDIMEELSKEIPEIREIYDMHVWVITSNMYSLTTHIALPREHTGIITDIRDRINTFLKVKYNIKHTTVEFDIED